LGGRSKHYVKPSDGKNLPGVGDFHLPGLTKMNDGQRPGQVLYLPFKRRIYPNFLLLKALAFPIPHDVATLWAGT